MTKHSQTQIFVIIPAGGVGVRFGGEEKKQFLHLGGESLVNRSIGAFLLHGRITSIVVALPLEEIVAQKASLSDRRVIYVEGGASRAASVRNGFLSLDGLHDNDVVLVHDAVRPLVSQELIGRVISTVEANGAALPVIPVSDTIKEVADDRVQRTINREHLRAAQTPQGFHYGLLRQIYGSGENLTQATDEAMLLEMSGHTVITVAGENENIKITTPFDFIVAEAILKCKLMTSSSALRERT